MQVHCQGLHDRNLTRLCAYELAQWHLRVIANLERWRGQLVIQLFEVSKNALRSPNFEVFVHIFADALWLQSQGVAAEIGARSRFVLV